jgi:phytoene dehydrogenase-like protein
MLQQNTGGGMKKIAVIGAGVSGMTAAIYCLKSGFDVTVFEKHSISGGVCTSWTRRGYTFEGAVHWLTDSAETDPLYRLWRDTGILARGVQTRRNDPWFVYRYAGKDICLYRDVEKLEAHFLEIAPEDAQAIHRLCGDIRSMGHLRMPVLDIGGLKTKNPSRMQMSALFRMLPALLRMGRFSKLSAAEYAAAFKHPGIKKLLSEFVIMGEYGSLSLFAALAALACSGVFPEGGSLALAKRMENNIRALGGTMTFNTKIEKIIVEQGTAKGIMANGEPLFFDGVIVTQDAITAQGLFDNPPKDKWLREMRNQKPVLCTFAGIGVHADLADSPCSFAIDERISVGGIEYDSLAFNNYATYSGYAPGGCTALTASFAGDSYDFWDNLRKSGGYDEQKRLLAGELTRIVEKHLPKTAGKIEVVNIATPLTYERYTGSCRGAWMTFMDKHSKPAMPEPLAKDINNIYFAGFRTIVPGGLPVALYSGFRAAQYACRDNALVFEGA